MNVSVMGTGYVGLVTGVCLADLGNRVILYDIDKEKIEKLQRGISPIYEPGIENYILKNRENLEFTVDIDRAIRASHMIFIAVGTPTLPSGQADLSAVMSVVEEIAKRLDTYKLIVIKSTVPVGTNEKIVKKIRERVAPTVSFDVASNPEFLREGSAIQDVFQADRIVIGAQSQVAFHWLEALYKPLQTPVVRVDPQSAEMIKYASNAFLATKISFINEIANLSEKVGANIDDVARGMGMDHRIGPHFLQAGIGYGGSCFPKDTNALVQMAGEVDYDFKILRSVIEVNAIQRSLLLDKLISELGSLQGKTIGVLGLTFKPHTDDMRESAAVDIIEFLIGQDASIKVFDPVAMVKGKELFPPIYIGKDEYDTIQDSDVVLILTDWPQFKEIQWSKAINSMKRNLIIDGRNLYDPQYMKDLGIIYHSFGRAVRGGKK